MSSTATWENTLKIVFYLATEIIAYGWYAWTEAAFQIIYNTAPA